MTIRPIANEVDQAAVEIRLGLGERLIMDEFIEAPNGDRVYLEKVRAVFEAPGEETVVSFGASAFGACLTMADMLALIGRRPVASNVIPGRLIDVWHCPTTWRVIDGLEGDDKVLCGCGRSNPLCPEERTRETGTHVKRFLQPATEAEWLAQIDQETRRG